MNSHASRLLSRAAELDLALQDEQRRPLPDSLRLQALKKRKLALRDELFDLKSKRAQAFTLH